MTQVAGPGTEIAPLVRSLRAENPEAFAMVLRILGDAEVEKLRLRVTVVDR